ncbi:MAG: hypothetical protein SVK54_00555 [candidate division WOR-3 bacterium]|nr:hypothetical protein [candidate division WOR-3 bacterium]
MLIPYRIKDTVERIPLFSIIIILLIIFVFIRYPSVRYINWMSHSFIENLPVEKYMSIHGMKHLLSQSNGFNTFNILLSLFSSQYIPQFLLNLWLAAVLLPFIENRTGRVFFVFLYMFFFLVLYTIARTGLYYNDYPFPFNQGILLLFTGYFYSVYFKMKIKVLYFFGPSESLKGVLDYPASAVILPLYFVVQIIIIGIVMLRRDILFLPTAGMLVNMVFCPVIGALTGYIIKRIPAVTAIDKYLRRPDSYHSAIDENNQENMELLISGDNDQRLTALNNLENSFISKPDTDVLHTLFTYYFKRGNKEHALKLIRYFLSKPDSDEISVLSDIIRIIEKNGGIDFIDSMDVKSRIKIIKGYYLLNRYEEARQLMKHLEDGENSKSYQSIVQYFEKEHFIW